jgi:uncharacterized sporulation protein YeaH/YhbH (DUF444 family)
VTSVIVDRRPDKGKSTANRQRVLKRLDGALKAQVDKLVARHKLQEHRQGRRGHHRAQKRLGAEFRPRSRLRSLRLDHSGQRSVSGGRQNPAQSHRRAGPRRRSRCRRGQFRRGRHFRFVLSREEYLSLLFDELELPPLVKKDLLEIDETRFRRGGVVRYGNPGSVCVTRTFKASIGRRVAAEAQHEEALEAAEAALVLARGSGAESARAMWRSSRCKESADAAPTFRFWIPSICGTATSSRCKFPPPRRSCSA